MADIVAWSRQLLEALVVLGKAKIYHGDFRVDNILIGYGGHIIVSDFGVSVPPPPPPPARACGGFELFYGVVDRLTDANGARWLLRTERLGSVSLGTSAITAPLYRASSA